MKQNQNAGLKTFYLLTNDSTDHVAASISTQSTKHTDYTASDDYIRTKKKEQQTKPIGQIPIETTTAAKS